MWLPNLWSVLMLRNRIKLFTIDDIVMISLILIATVGSCFLISRNRSDLRAYVYYKNSLLGIYELSKPMIIEINENCKAEIKNGSIRMLTADCPDQRCVKQSWSNLLPIICLPNQIVIEFKNNQKQQMHILQ